jgi:hypothetical protein
MAARPQVLSSPRGRGDYRGETISHVKIAFRRHFASTEGLQLGKQVVTRLSLRQEVNYRLLIKPSDVNRMENQEKNVNFPGPAVII